MHSRSRRTRRRKRAGTPRRAGFRPSPTTRVWRSTPCAARRECAAGVSLATTRAPKSGTRSSSRFSTASWTGPPGSCASRPSHHPTDTSSSSKARCTARSRSRRGARQALATTQYSSSPETAARWPSFRQGRNIASRTVVAPARSCAPGSQPERDHFERAEDGQLSTLTGQFASADLRRNFICGRKAVKRLVISLAVLVLTLALASSTAAHATSYTQTVHDATDAFLSVIPCTGAPATITVTYNGVFHINSLPGGEFWTTFTQTGTVSAVPLDPTQPTLTGRFTIWGNFNLNERNQNTTFTFTVRLSDGSVFHDTAHFTMNANGEITTTFDKPSCH